MRVRSKDGREEVRMERKKYCGDGREEVRMKGEKKGWKGRSKDGGEEIVGMEGKK